VETYELLYPEIDRLQCNFFQVNIEHRCPHVIRETTIKGIFTARMIKAAIQRFDLPVRTA
jgi:hypothetical protein